jgi:hypothetical protein
MNFLRVSVRSLAFAIISLRSFSAIEKAIIEQQSLDKHWQSNQFKRLIKCGKSKKREPTGGIEPSTCRLRSGCSATELCGLNNIQLFFAADIPKFQTSPATHAFNNTGDEEGRQPPAPE